MPKPPQAGEFFVAGGPVQPDRACYIERAADGELARGIAEQRFCYVLSARATGKSSLMGRAIRDLRRDGQLAAVVDLNQIGARGDRTDAGRWYYAIAYRIVRELRLKIDLQAWWQQKSALPGEQRLTEFFSDVVLAPTSASITIFIDEIERTRELSYARDLFATIHACYARRVSEPAYSRLNFVVLGVASPAALCPDTGASPFIHGRAIEPADFTLEQSMHLAPGFQFAADDAGELIARIHGWTGGQPYLTQKIARGVARKGGRAADVDRVVREQFLAPGARQKEPYLAHIRAQLGDRGPRSRQALTLLGKVARGTPVAAEPASPARELLRLAGVTAAGEGGVLRYRNPLLREVFNERWIAGARPFDWRGVAATAALLAVTAVGAVWYSQVLPRPYIDTLSVVTQDFAVAEEAYERLRRLPGFAGTADRLLAEAMTRRSRGSDDHDEVLAADRVLRDVLGRGALADELMADYWLRQAAQARRAERRDEALLLAVQALPGRDAEVRRAATELIGADYRRLTATFRFPRRALRWAVDWDARRLAVVDPAHRVQRLAFGVDAGGARGASAPSEAMPGRLTALQQLPVRREIGVEDAGSAGAFRLQLRVQHPRPEDLLLTLTAPSGASARMPLEQQSPEQQRYSFSAAGDSPFAALADEGRQGVWRFTVVDRDGGQTGVLLHWGLEFSETSRDWRDEPEQGVAIPDPVRTAQVHVEVSGDGRYAAVWPAREGTVGALALWDLVAGRRLHDLEVAGVPDNVAFTAGATRLLVQSEESLALWSVMDGRRVGVVETQTGFVLPPAPSADGDFVALAERVDDAPPLFSLVRASDGEHVASASGVAGAGGWVLGPEARYAAVIESTARGVAVVDPRRGTVLRELGHERRVLRLIAVPNDDLLLTVDDAGDVRAWHLPLNENAPPGESWLLGTTADPGSVSVSADGSTAAFEVDHGEVVVRDVAGELQPVHLRLDGAGERIETSLAPDGGALVTAGERVLRVWRLEERELGGAPEPNLTALAIDRGGAVAALGFRGGHVRVRSESELARRPVRAEGVDYIGHRGQVTSLAINAARSRIASGGGDGVVRAWDLASVAPSEHFMRHPLGPVHAVAVSPDGRWIASAAEYSARIWRASDGTLSAELPVNGTALAVAFSPDSSKWAVGDSAGNVFVGEPDGDEPLGSLRAQGPVAAVAFGPDGRLLASGDEIGNVELWDLDGFSSAARRHGFAHPVRWLRFAGSDGRLVVQTERWIHRMRTGGGRMRVESSRLLEAGVGAGAALAGADGERVRLVGGLGASELAFHELSFDAPPASPLEPGAPLLERDWSTTLGLRVDDAGEVSPVEH